MTAAYVEHRPRSNEPKEPTIHFAVVVNGKDVEKFRTQEDAVSWAKKQGYSPIHVARVRHLQDRDQPDHWRRY